MTLTFRLTLTLVTFDLDQCDFYPWPIWPFNIAWKPVKWGPKSRFFDLVTLTYDLDHQGRSLGHPRPCSDQISWPYVQWFMRYEFRSSHRQTYRQNTMHMSPPCIRTGGLKNYWHTGYLGGGVLRVRARALTHFFDTVSTFQAKKHENCECRSTSGYKNLGAPWTQ